MAYSELRIEKELYYRELLQKRANVKDLNRLIKILKDEILILNNPKLVEIRKFRKGIDRQMQNMWWKPISIFNMFQGTVWSKGQVEKLDTNYFTHKSIIPDE